MEKTYRILVILPTDLDDGHYLFQGAKLADPNFERFNAHFSDRYTKFLTNQGKVVYTNLPVLIEEE